MPHLSDVSELSRRGSYAGYTGYTFVADRYGLVARVVRGITDIGGFLGGTVPASPGDLGATDRVAVRRC